MKVTVCFGNTRVIVPCGNGDIPVTELVNKAVTRYKKAKGKTADFWVSVHNVKSGGDGGILDPDDLLCDVADDKDQLIAIYEEEGDHPSVLVGVRGVHPHHEGDGTSDSSVGTESPDLFPSGADREGDGEGEPGKDVQVTAEDLASGTFLSVRRGSDTPFLGAEDEDKPWKSLPAPTAIPNADLPSSQGSSQSLSTMNPSRESSLTSLPSSSPPPSALTPFVKSTSGRFERSSGRQSMLRNQGIDKWVDAQDRVLGRRSPSPSPIVPTAQRREPVGGSPEPRRNNNDSAKQTSPPLSSSSHSPVPFSDSTSPPSASSPKSSQLSSHPSSSLDPTSASIATSSPTSKSSTGDDDDLIVLPNEDTPLGIHVIADYDENNVSQGLFVQSIEPGGRVARDGRLRAADRIVEINGTPLLALDFRRAQEVFRKALLTEAVRLRVCKAVKDPPAVKPTSTIPKTTKTPPPIAPKPNRGRLSTIKSESEPSPAILSQPITATSLTRVSPVEDKQRAEFCPSPDDDEDSIREDDDPDSSPFLRTPSGKTPGAKSSVNFNTRKIGKKLYIQLSKGPHGLGFSITTRDNAAGGASPIYIKNILPRGAAIVDGRLKSGDRLLEVNGVQMTGRSQAEAVSLLRSIKLGSVVNLVVSRQVPLEPNLPRKIPAEKMSEEDVADTRQREILTFNVPLNATEAAGLGISVKGKTTTGPHGSQDLGIFIKSIIQGGAASKDTRLRVNDQLIGINGDSLLGMNNQEAMEALRSSMLKDAPVRGHISLVVARRIGDAPNSRSCSGSTTPDVPSPNMICFPPDAPVASPELNAPVSSPEPPAPFNNPPSSTAPDSGSDDGSQSSVHVIMAPVVPPPPPKDDDSDGEFSSELDSLRHPVLDRLTGADAAPNVDATDGLLYNASYLEATSMSFREGLRGSSSTRSSARSWGDAERPCEEPKTNATADPENHAIPGPEDEERRTQQNGEYQLREVKSEEDLTGDGQFHRDGVGRQSISEKRHGTIDAKTTKQYWEIKAKRGESPSKPAPSARDSAVSRPKTTHFEGVDVTAMIMAAEDKKMAILASEKPPPLRRSASLESLQRAVQKRDSENEIDRHQRGIGGRGRSRVSRGKKKNESFRAAVDRSFDPDGRVVKGQESAPAPLPPEVADEDDPELAAAAAASNLPHPDVVGLTGNRGRSATSMSSERSLDEDSPLKKDKKKDKSKSSGLLKGLFSSKKNRSGEKKGSTKSASGLRPKSADPDLARKGRDSAEEIPSFDPRLVARASSRGYPGQPHYAHAQQLPPQFLPPHMHPELDPASFYGATTPDQRPYQVGNYPSPSQLGAQLGPQHSKTLPHPILAHQNSNPHSSASPYQTLSHVQSQMPQQMPPPLHHPYLTENNLGQRDKLQQQLLHNNLQRHDRMSISSLSSQPSSLSNQRHPQHAPVPLHHLNHPYHPQQQHPAPTSRLPPPSSSNPYSSLGAPQPWRPPQNLPPPQSSSVPFGDYRDSRHSYQQQALPLSGRQGRTGSLAAGPGGNLYGGTGRAAQV